MDNMTNRIMLICSAGMSTSLLVQRMERAAKERNIECRIWAGSEAEARSQLDNCDLILFGPQVRFLKITFEKLVGERPVKLDVIDTISYGKMDGNSILDYAMGLLAQS